MGRHLFVRSGVLLVPQFFLGMTKAEMILKVVMTPIEPQKNFIDQCKKLLPERQLTEFYKMLEMKSIKRQEQAMLVDLFKSQK